MASPSVLPKPPVYFLPTYTPLIVGPVNLVLIREDPVTLIDAPTKHELSWQSLLENLNACGVTVKDIQRILLTHHHIDHTGLVQRIVEESGAEVFAHPQLIAENESSHRHDDDARHFYFDLMAELGVPQELCEEAMALWQSFKEFAERPPVHHAFTDGGRVGDFETYFVPGHSSTDTLLVNRRYGFTAVGDHLLTMFTPNPLLRRPPKGKAREKSLIQYYESIEKSYGLDLGLCLPGHGDPFDDHRSVIDGIRAKWERINERILRLLPSEGATPYEVATRLYPGVKLQHLYLVLSVATGHLEWLEKQGRVVSSRADGRLQYRAALNTETK